MGNKPAYWEPEAGGSYVDRGDPAVADFIHTDLTLDNTWRDLDLSGIVASAGYGRLVLLRLVLRATAAGVAFRFRQKGRTSDLARHSFTHLVANLTMSGSCWVLSDAGGVIQYLGHSTYNNVSVVVAGWME